MKTRSLETAIIVSSIIAVVVTGVIVTGFGFTNATNAVNSVAASLRKEKIDRVTDHLADFFATPQRVLAENARLLADGILDPNDPEGLSRHFIRQNQTFGSFNSVYFGNSEGGLTGAGIEVADGSLYITSTPGFRAGTFEKRAASPDGAAGALLLSVPDFDARTRPWYKAAAASDTGAWSEVYILFTGHDMAITPSRAVRAPDGALIGVVGGDLFLSGISNFLARLHEDRVGLTFVMDRQGRLLATSTGAPLFSMGENAGPGARLHAVESKSVPIAYAARAIEESIGNLGDISGYHSTSVTLDGDRHFVELKPFEEAYGLSLLVATVIPETVFTQSVAEGNARTVLLIICAVGLIIGGTVLWTRHIAQPIASLTQSVEQNEEKFQAIFDNAATGIARIGPDGAWLEVNRKLCKLLDYTEEELYERTFQELTHPDDLAENLALYNKALSGEINAYNMEKRFRRKDGTHFWAELSVSLVRDANGQPKYFISIIQRIDARKRAEAALRHAKGEADKANRAKSDFLAAMSHDLRTPLNAIMGFSEMMRSKIFGPLGDKRYEEYVTHIHKSGSLLISLINDVLDLSKVEAGKYELHEEDIDLRALCDDCVQQLSAIATLSEVTVTADLPAALPKVIADERALVQVLNNLLSNAVKFTPAGGTVQITARHDPAHGISLSVTDTGIGMSEDDTERAMQPFEQAESNTTHVNKGTGLGLYLCIRFMELLGGGLAIDSAPGRGTTVTVTIPEERVLVRDASVAETTPQG